MANAYSYALLVEFEESNIPKLKNKLVKYFQSNKKSHGGDCEVDYDNGSKTALVRFLRQEDQQNVLAKGTHQISLDAGRVLNVTVRLSTNETTRDTPSTEPSNKSADVAVNQNQPRSDQTPAAEAKKEEKGGGEQTADEELCSTCVVLGNIPETANLEFLDMLVENVLKDCDSDSQNFTTEVIPDTASAVVTFESGKEAADFVTRCPKNRTFARKGMSIRLLEVTEQVVVEDLKNFDEDRLCLYFENLGVVVENVVLSDVEQTPIITFKDHGDVQKVLKMKHRIKKEEIRLYPFYESLGTALYGKDERPLKLPAPVSETIDGAVWRYLSDKQASDKTTWNDLEKHFCSVDLSQSDTVCLKPVASLLQQKDVKALSSGWRDAVKSALTQVLSNIKLLKLQPSLESWEKSVEKIRETLVNEDVVAVPDKTRGVLSVVGLVQDVSRVEPTLNKVISSVDKQVQRAKFSVSEDISVSPSIFHILCQDGFQDRLKAIYPELVISPNTDNTQLTAIGLREEISAVTKTIYNEILALKRQDLEMDRFVLDFLKNESPEKLTQDLLMSRGKNAAFQMTGDRLQLFAVSGKHMTDAVDHLGRLLISQNLNVEDTNVLVKPEWKALVKKTEDSNNKSSRTVQIHTTDQQVVVCGYSDMVRTVSRELEEFLKRYAHVKEKVTTKSRTIVEYISRRYSPQLDDMKDKSVTVTCSNDAFCLSGSRVDVAKCRTSVEKLISSVSFEPYHLLLPGAEKFFKDKESMYVSTLLMTTGCVVELVSASNRQDGQAPKQAASPVYQLQTSDGVEIAVWKADVCSYSADVVVCPSDENLKLNSGLSGALLKAAGPQLQEECDNIVSSEQLSPGDCVITGAGGKLSCKKLIHAVAPMFDKSNQQKSVAQLKRAVVRSLDLAEKYGYTSVALPALRRDLAFPLALCAATIIRAVKQHCEDKYGDNTLKKIHFVDSADGVVMALEQAVRQEFGNHGVGQARPPPSSPKSSPKSSPSKHAGPDPDFLGQVHTKEGLGITLMKGNIQDAMTDAIVNSVSGDLELDKGAVSNAILTAAGPRLQQLVDAKNANGDVGEVIVTDGCNLKSKHVFHAITPYWDQGADKILSDIFNDCLDKAEKASMTSISFPAMGTGNLGFPKDLAASLLLDALSAYSSAQQLQHLKEVVIVLYPGDKPTIQAFSDAFKKKFPNASLPKASSQDQGPFSKIVSSSGMHETTMGNVTVQVVTGDITQETSDIIVNSSNDNFTLKSGVSKAILDAAGPTVEKECQMLSAEAHQGYILTRAGNLKCKRILHVPGKGDPAAIHKLVKVALEKCVNNSFTSVSFPAIGTGQGNAQAKQVADAMLDAVIDVLSQNPSSAMKTVRIVIFQAPMLKDFAKSMQEREVTGPKDKSKHWLSWSTIKSFFTGSSGTSATVDKKKKKGDFVIHAKKVDPASFHICGESKVKTDEAKKWIHDLISKEQTSTHFSDSAILKFSDADEQRIADIQKTLGVSITVESKSNQPSLAIAGISKDVVEASKEITEMLSKIRKEQELRRDVEKASSEADWQYLLPGSQFQSFDDMTNYQLEQAFTSNQTTVNITLQGQDYTVTMPKGPATDSQGSSIELKRIDKLKDVDIPDDWEAMPAGATCHTVPIAAGTPEYNDVESLFKATCQKNILKIERIQNPVMWKSLQIKKLGMESKNPTQTIERRLFHGTREDSVAHINTHGFNRSYAGMNAAVYGNGSYFAVKASYSAHNKYSQPNQNGEKLMYLCRVLTGEFTLGQQGLVVPPPKTALSSDQYDSVVDDMANPSMFIVFYDNQAYPEHLITFK
ncbi:uncharacterized protein V6R79_001842 [Siganus canaliculatus]